VFLKNDLYHLVTVKDGKSDTAAIIDVLLKISTGRLKCDLTLLNYYDEVPITYSSTLTTVEKDSIELAVHEHQAVIIKEHKSTLIKSKHFHSDLGVHCYAAYVNVPKKTAILHNFAYAQIRAERREAVRVKVHGSIPVKFFYDNVAIEGNIVDLSTTGISIRHGLAAKINSGQLVQLNFTLNNTSLAVPGLFGKSIEIEASDNISIFQIKPGRMADNIIGQFIYQRQVEIIQQLKDGLILE
jgi:hypothetical protein